MKLTFKVANWTVIGVLTALSMSALTSSVSAKIRDGILPADERAVRWETQLPTAPQAAPAPVEWAAPIDSQKNGRAVPVEVKDNQEVPSDSLAAENAMLAKLKKPDGRTRKGLGIMFGIMGFFGLLSAGSSAFLGVLLYMGLGALLIATGHKKYKQLKAAQAAAGGAPYQEVKGRVGRGALLAMFLAGALAGLFLLVGSILEASGSNVTVVASSGTIGVLIGLVLVLGIILLLWRGGAYAKAMQANGFPPKRK